MQNISKMQYVRFLFHVVFSARPHEVRAVLRQRMHGEARRHAMQTKGTARNQAMQLV